MLLQLVCSEQVSQFVASAPIISTMGASAMGNLHDGTSEHHSLSERGQPIGAQIVIQKARGAAVSQKRALIMHFDQ